MLALSDSSEYNSKKNLKARDLVTSVISVAKVVFNCLVSMCENCHWNLLKYFKNLCKVISSIRKNLIGFKAHSIR